MASSPPGDVRVVRACPPDSRCCHATAVSAEFDDRKFTGSHYGHICFCRVTPKSVILADQKEGSMRNDIYEMKKTPENKAERDKLLAGRSVTYPAKLEAGKWYTLLVETALRQSRRDKTAWMRAKPDDMTAVVVTRAG